MTLAPTGQSPAAKWATVFIVRIVKYEQLVREWYYVYREPYVSMWVPAAQTGRPDPRQGSSRRSSLSPGRKKTASVPKEFCYPLAGSPIPK